MRREWFGCKLWGFFKRTIDVTWCNQTSGFQTANTHDGSSWSQVVSTNRDRWALTDPCLMSSSGSILKYILRPGILNCQPKCANFRAATVPYYTKFQAAVLLSLCCLLSFLRDLRMLAVLSVVAFDIQGLVSWMMWSWQSTDSVHSRFGKLFEKVPAVFHILGNGWFRLEFFIDHWWLINCFTRFNRCFDVNLK